MDVFERIGLANIAVRRKTEAIIPSSYEDFIK
jgi:hypothetical protein